MTRTITLMLVQPKPYDNNITSKRNVERALSFLDKACRRELDVVVFPEYYPFYYDDRLREKAVDCGFYIIAGVRHVREGVAYNTAAIVSPRDTVVWQGKRSIGRLEARLWGFKPWPYDYVVVDTGRWRLGVAVCADFWSIPEAALELFLGGAEIFINPAYMFSMVGHWLSANLSRSLDFYTPVVGVDMAPFPLKTKRYTFTGGGYSHVIVPPATPEEAGQWWSNGAQNTSSWVRLQLGTDEATAIYTIDLDSLADQRREWWRRMRGLGLEEWIKLRIDRGYPWAKLVKA